MKAIYTIFMISITITGNAGTLVGNGGDSIYCDALSTDAKFPYSGLYVLDYAIIFPSGLKGTVITGSLESSLDRIQELLDLHTPEMGTSFREYRLSLPNRAVSTVARQWRPSKRDLINVMDESVDSIPPNCTIKNNGHFKIFHQTVLRRSVANGVIYDYDEDVVGDYLSQANGLQASILFVHEWLWDTYKAGGAWRIRQANAFLHSLEAEKVSSDEFIRRVFKIRRP